MDWSFWIGYAAGVLCVLSYYFQVRGERRTWKKLEKSWRELYLRLDSGQIKRSIDLQRGE